MKTLLSIAVVIYKCTGLAPQSVARGQQHRNSEATSHTLFSGGSNICQGNKRYKTKLALIPCMDHGSRTSLEHDGWCACNNLKKTKKNKRCSIMSINALLQERATTSPAVLTVNNATTISVRTHVSSRKIRRLSSTAAGKCVSSKTSSKSTPLNDPNTTQKLPPCFRLITRRSRRFSLSTSARLSPSKKAPRW